MAITFVTGLLGSLLVCRNTERQREEMAGAQEHTGIPAVHS